MGVALVAVEMGYGHLRAAYPLADELGVPVLECDRPPVASPEEQERWRRTRSSYELVSRASEVPLLGQSLRRLLDAVTHIPHLYPSRDLSQATLAVRTLEGMWRRGLGSGLVHYLREHDATLVTTFYAPAIMADLHGLSRIVCVVTDSDLNRVWAPRHAADTRIHYCVPCERAGRRLRAYGVPRERLHETGFPLPPELLGGTGLPALRRNLAARLVRLDPKGVFREQAGQELDHFLGGLPDGEEGRPPRLTFAIGGAGAQLGLARSILTSLREAIGNGQIQLSLVAGVRTKVAEELHRTIRAAGLDGLPGRDLEVVHEGAFEPYYRRFNALLAETDILWTKPSELSFYGALGIPLVFSWPIGAHERYNRRWALHRGAGFKQENPRFAWDWLREWLREGTLAAAAWSGYQRLPKFGTYRILDVVRRVSAAA